VPRIVRATAASLLAHLGLASLVHPLVSPAWSARSRPVEVVAVSAESQPPGRPAPVLESPRPEPPGPRQRRLPHEDGARAARLGLVQRRTPSTDSQALVTPDPMMHPMAATESRPDGLAAAGLAAVPAARQEGTDPGGVRAREPVRGVGPAVGAVSADPCRPALTALSSGLSQLDFPAWMRGLGLGGTVRVALRIGRDGRPRGVRVARSSGDQGLDRHAAQAVRSLHDIPTCSREITVPIEYVAAADE